MPDDGFKALLPSRSISRGPIFRSGWLSSGRRSAGVLSGNQRRRRKRRWN